MATPTHIVSGGNKRYAVTVSNNGQIVTAPYAYDMTEFRELAATNTAYNFYTPIGGKQFVMTGVYAVADKQVSGSVSAAVIVYEATSAGTTTVAKVLVQTAIVQDQVHFFSGLNILVSEGVFINAKTTDDDVHMTITGYFIPNVE